jgi:antitoxin PrlF
MTASLQLTSMTTKGQVVIPNEIRRELSVASGSKFVVLSDGKNILLKPIQKPKMEQFKELQKRSQAIAKSAGFKKSDIPKQIKKVRRENRD